MGGEDLGQRLFRLVAPASPRLCRCHVDLRELHLLQPLPYLGFISLSLAIELSAAPAPLEPLEDHSVEELLLDGERFVDDRVFALAELVHM